MDFGKYRYHVRSGKRAVRMFDSTFNYVCGPIPSGTRAYIVEKAGLKYVLKLARSDDEWALNHIREEADILLQAAELPRITHLVSTYGQVGEYGAAILKEYFEGTTLWDLRQDLTDSHLQALLEDTVRSLHAKGLERLDLTLVNVAVSPDSNSVCIIDLGRRDIPSGYQTRARLPDALEDFEYLTRLSNAWKNNK